VSAELVVLGDSLVRHVIEGEQVMEYALLAESGQI